MSDAPVMPQWIDVSQVDDVRDVVHRAVACLAQGGVVGLATETVYALGLAQAGSRPWREYAAFKKSEPSAPADVAAQRSRGSHRLGPANLDVGRRMASRLWPDPATLVFPARWSTVCTVACPARSSRWYRRMATSRCEARRRRSSETCCGSARARSSSRWQVRPHSGARDGRGPSWTARARHGDRCRADSFSEAGDGGEDRP